MTCRTALSFAIALLIATLANAGPASALDSAGETTVEDPLAYTMTGDELWDTYAQAILDRINLDIVGDKPYYAKHVILPTSVIQGWEQDFRDDPRYWQLRIYNASLFEDYAESGEQPPYELIRAALRNGASDQTTMELYYLMKQDNLQKLAWFSDFEDLTSLQQWHPEEFPDLPSAGEETLAWYVEQRGAVLEEWVSRYPDNRLAWYSRAAFLIDYANEMPEAFYCLQMGNNATGGQVPLLFPESFVKSRLASGLDCGNEAVAGMIAMTGYHYLMEVGMGPVLHAPNADALTPTSVADLAEFAVNYAQADASDDLMLLEAGWLLEDIVKFLVVERGDEYTKSQREALWQVLDELHLANITYDGHLTRDSRRFGYLRREAEELTARLSAMTVGESVPTDAELREEYNALVAELATLRFRYEYESASRFETKTRPSWLERLEHVAQFDFVNLVWPAEDSESVSKSSD